MKLNIYRQSIRLGFLLGMFAFAGTLAQAQVTITITAGVTAGSGNFLGYTPGPTPVTLTFTTVANTTVNEYVFTGTDSLWGDTPSQLLWDSITGTGITGAYSPTDPMGTLGTDSTSFQFETMDDSGGSTGLLANGNEINQIIGLNLVFTDVPTFSHSGVPSTPEDYFATYAGLHAVSVGATLMMVGVGGTDSVSLVPFTVDIAVAVPEPATYVSILGGLALAGTLIRRRRKHP